MFELKITADTATELKLRAEAALAMLTGGTYPVAEEPQPEKKSTRSRSAKQDTEVSSGSASTPESGSKTSETGPTATTIASPSEEGEITYADVQKAVNGLALKKGRQSVLNVFDTFGVDHGSKLDASQWAEAILALNDARDAE